MWIYFQLLLIGLTLADEILPECKELYKANDPRPCCDVPSLLGQEEFIAECKTKCEGTPDDVCCPLDCLIEVSEIFVGGQVNHEKVKEFSMAMSKRHGESMLQWNPVMKSSQEECSKMLQSMESDVPPSTCQSAALIPFIICMQQSLFLNCPTFTASESCDAVKTFVDTQDKCGLNLGDKYYLDGLFWRYLEPVAVAQ